MSDRSNFPLSVEDDSMIAALFAAIATVVLTEPPGTSAVRRMVDASAISRINSIISSKTDPALLEQGLEVIRALGSRRGTLTLEEVRSVAPMIANVMRYVVLGQSPVFRMTPRAIYPR